MATDNPTGGGTAVALNDYEQVLLEHRALCGLLGQLEERSGR